MNKKGRKQVIYAFIDSQNLNLGTSKDVRRGAKLVYKGWKLDFKKFKRYLEDKFRVDKIFLFIGYIKENQKLYDNLQSYGYKMIYKPTVMNEVGKPKGNVDAELVLYSSAIEYSNYDKAVIVSGDGDFRCLVEFLEKRKKLLGLVIPNRYSESSLLKEFQSYKTILNREQAKLEFKP